MKKLLTLLSLGLILTVISASYAQAQNAFEQGKVIGTAGLILESGVTPVVISAEYGVTDAIGVGGRLSYYSTGGASVFSIEALGNYHFAQVFNVTGNKLDPYAGITLGKPFVSVKGGSGSGDVFVAGQIGARYLVNEKVGPYAQLNLGFVNASGSSFEIGVAYKFGQ